MYAGKQAMRHLIRELRISEDPPAEQQADRNEATDQALDSIQGEVVSSALDFISKEVVRVSEERKIAALVRDSC